jgi:hypothetical protein
VRFPAGPLKSGSSPAELARGRFAAPATPSKITLMSGFIRPLPDGPWVLRDCDGGVGAVRMLSNCLERSLLSDGTFAESAGLACASKPAKTALGKNEIMESPRHDLVTVTSLCARWAHGDC